MSPRELLELIAGLKAAGITHFKQGDLELSFGSDQKAEIKIQPAIPMKVSSLKELPKESEQEPPHIIQEMKTLFAMPDNKLVERLFPDPMDDEAQVQ